MVLSADPRCPTRAETWAEQQQFRGPFAGARCVAVLEAVDKSVASGKWEKVEVGSEFTNSHRQEEVMSAEPPKAVYGELHDPLTATWQFIEMARLNETLKECGVESVELRRSILENYFFNSGYFFDSQWFEQDSRHFHPTLAFIEIDANKQPTCCFLPDPDFGTCLHEYAHGCAGQLFEDYGEVVTDVVIGDCNI